jgi:hypothetical protein
MGHQPRIDAIRPILWARVLAIDRRCQRLQNTRDEKQERPGAAPVSHTNQIVMSRKELMSGVGSILTIIFVVLLAAYALKFGRIYIIKRQRPDWNAEREQFKRDWNRGMKLSKRISRMYWRGWH